MKISNSFSYYLKFGITSIIGFLFFNFYASAKKIYMTKGSDNGLYINALTSGFSYAPGDTFVLKASMSPFAYFSLEEFHGTASQPIVVINEGGQTQVAAMGFRHCTYMKITGTGSSDQYGFYMTMPNQTSPSPAIAINGRSSDVEVDHVDINTHGYGFWVKEEGSCDVTLQYPNWRLNNISIHDCRIRNLIQEGIYAGSTAPNGERPVTCNGVVTNPLPIRLGNIKIYNNIIDHTGRGGIQLSAADYGSNEIYNNTVTNSGYEFATDQGNGIILGNYTTAYVHDNTVDNTFSTGIFSLGSGMVRIENNKVDHSGSLAGRTANGSASIMVDTRLTSPVILTTFYIKNNILGSNTDGNIRLYNTYPNYTTSNLICTNTTTTGGQVVIYANNGISYQTCVGNQTPTANAGPDQTVTLPTNSVTLNGSGTDPDGTIASYQWSEVSGPNNVTISNTNSAQTIMSNLVQGTYTFSLKVTDNGGASSTDVVLVTVQAASTSTTTTTSSSIHIEAESYSAMSGIQTENTSDVGGGKDVGWQDTGDWMDYAVNVSSAGTYTVNFRVASMFTGAQFQLRNSTGTVLATVTVPNTGSFQTWQTISASVTLPAGQQTLRIYTSNANGGWNINWWEIAGASSSTNTTTTSSPIHIEAESFSAMSGIQTENTSDVGGGQNVGWQDTGDWMDYAVNVSSAGTYTVNFRVASMFTGAQFQLRNSTGTVLATVTVPNTGSFQTWQTISASVTLPAGQQTLRIYTSNANGGWNINWWEILTSGSAGSTVKTASLNDVSVLNSTDPLSIFPNPIQDHFSVKLDNQLTGKLTITFVNSQGQIVKQFSLTKANTGPTQWYLSLANIPTGNYVLTATMNNYKQSVKVIKE